MRKIVNCLMTGFLVVLSGCSSFANPDHLESRFVMASLIGLSNEPPLIEGKAYVISPFPLKVLSKTTDGVLIEGYSHCFIKTKNIEDNQGYVFHPVCAVYDGMEEFTTILGIHISMPSFRHISCKPYAAQISDELNSYAEQANRILDRQFHRVNSQ